MTAPCKGCTKRFLTCHDTCEEYQKFKKENKEAAKRWSKDADRRHTDVQRALRKKKGTYR